MEIAILAALILVIILLVIVMISLYRDATARAELAGMRATSQTLQSENATLAANLENERHNAAEKIKLLQDAEVRLKTEFENLANRIFEDKGKTLKEQNRDHLSGLLQPFKEQLESFRKRVDDVHKDDTELSARLLEQVSQLQKMSNKVSDEANNLAKAIKGDVKKQGDWGELIVERIFEASGLRRGIEYSPQAGFRDDDGSLMKPDFVVYLPGDKAVIVDSKVSLTAFERFCSVDEDAGRNLALSEHVQSVRKHIEELSAKKYTDILGNKSLDFVLMCIPLEPAYQAALQADQNILYNLARTHIVITGPSTLMITLKLIAQIWRRENENRNAEIIADKAGKIYDQVKLIVDAMQDAQKNLTNVASSFELAMKRLKDGKGNLIGRVEEIRRLGADVSKQIHSSVIEDAVAGESRVENEPPALI